MRLLAYGGTGFSERCRIGAWPEVQSDLLSDTDRVIAGSLVYGVTLLGDAAVIIYRERQNVEHRGGYPYTVLLDPGQETWQRFGWNGASLIAALFSNADSPGASLLQNPELFNAETLDNLLRALPRKADDSGAASLHPFVALLAAQIKPTTIQSFSSQALSWDALPPAVHLARLLDSVPPAIRIGRGWLIGASAAYVQRIGASLAVDNVRPVSDSELQQSTAAGEVLWTVLEYLRKHEKSTFANFGALPLHRWSDQEGMWRNSKLLHDLLSSPSDQLFDEAANCVNGPLLNCVKRAGCAMALEKGDTLSAAATRLLLQCCESGLIQADARTAARFDQETVLKEILSGGAAPRSIPNFSTPDSILVNAWSRYVEQGQIDAPERLQQALAATAHMKNLRSPELLRSAQAAIASSGVLLRNWLPVCAQLGPEFRRSLQSQAGNRIRTAPGLNTLLDYIAIGDDPGGAKLSAADVPLKIAISKLLSTSSWECISNDVVQKWFLAIAESPLRGGLSFELKSRILYAFASNAESWRGFRWVAMSLQGERMRPPALSKTEHDILKAEFEHGLISVLTPSSNTGPLQPVNTTASGQNVPAVPALASLVRELGPLRPAILSLLERAEPPRDPAWKVELWLENLRACGLHARADRVAYGHVMEWIRDPHHVSLLRPAKLGDAATDKVFEALLFEEIPEFKQDHNPFPIWYLQELISSWRGEAGKTLVRTIRAGLRLEEQTRLFCRRFTEYADVVELLDLIAPYDSSGRVMNSVLECLLMEKAIRAKVLSNLASLKNINGTQGEKILQSYVRKNERLLKQLGSEQHGISGVAHNLRRWFRRDP